MISYSFQGVVTILLGSVFTVFVLFFNPNRAESSYFANSTYHWLYQIGTEIAWCAFQINLFLAVSIAIATMARFRQVVPVAELVFLASLLQYESYVLVTGFYSSALLFESLQRYVAIYILMLFCPLFLMELPNDTSNRLADIIRSCATVRDYPNPEFLISYHVALLGWSMIIYGAGTTFMFLLGAGNVNVPRDDCRARNSGFCSAAGFICVRIGSKVKLLRDACILLRPCYSRFCSAIRVCSRWWGALTISFGTIVWTTMMVLSFIDLQSNRRKLQDLSNSAYQEEQWGFGQVMAILAWVPFFQDFFVKGVFGKRLNLCSVLIFQRPYRVFVIQEW